jgi:tetratricopeptide (TPR) repeat protein
VRLLSLAAVLVARLSVAGVPSPQAAGTSAPPAAAEAVAEADRLHEEAGRSGEAEESLRHEVKVLEEALAAHPDAYALLWRAARAENQLGTHLSGKEQKKAYDEAIDLGKRAVAANDDGVEGHFWLGVSYGRGAQVRGGLGAFFMARKLRGQMEAVVRLQPDYEGGDAFLALGELDRGLPGFLGGNKDRGRRYFEEGLRVAPDNADLKLALAKAYLDEHRKEDARRLLEELVSPSASGPAPDESLVREARKLLESLGPGEASPGS